MKKKVSVEIWDKYLHYLPTVKIELRDTFNMEITNIRKCGSIFGYLEDTFFDKVEDIREVIGVFEVSYLPDELPLLPGKVAESNPETSTV